MAQELDVMFEVSDRPEFIPTEEGKYPAHIVSLQTKEVNTRAGEAIIVNMSYQLADEAADETQLLWEMDGYKYRLDVKGERIPITDETGVQTEIKCEHLPGKKFYDNGFFIFTDTSSANKNSRYFKLLEGLGIKLEEVNGKKKLVLIEEEDVIGKPVIITLETHSYITRDTKDLPADQQEKRTTLKAKEVVLWDGGEELSQEEVDDDVPF
tara:strand:+ start:1148 stop:1777 length:630 start_codon:yes stop_codon:yes gene_type:complete